MTPIVETYAGIFFRLNGAKLKTKLCDICNKPFESFAFKKQTKSTLQVDTPHQKLSKNSFTNKRVSHHQQPLQRTAIRPTNPCKEKMKGTENQELVYLLKVEGEKVNSKICKPANYPIDKESHLQSLEYGKRLLKINVCDLHFKGSNYQKQLNSKKIFN